MTQFAEIQNETKQIDGIFSKNKDIYIAPVPGFIPCSENSNLYFSESNGYIVNIQEIENPNEWGPDLDSIANTLNNIHIKDITKYNYNVGNGFEFSKNAFNSDMSIEYKIYLATITNTLPEGDIMMKMIDVYFSGAAGSVYQMIMCTPWVIDNNNPKLHEKVQLFLMKFFDKFAAAISSVA